MNTVRLPFHLFNLGSALLPARSHGLRAWLLRRCGAEIGKRVALNGAVRVYSPYLHIGSDTWIGQETVFLTSPAGKVTILSRCDI